METSQLVFNKDGETITAAGYLINNKMLQQGQPAAVLTGGSNILSAIESLELAVPLGLIYLQDLAKKSSDSFNTSVFDLYSEDEQSTVELVEDSLYEKLLAMVDVEKETPLSKKHKRTRKNKMAFSADFKKTRGHKH